MFKHYSCYEKHSEIKCWQLYEQKYYLVSFTFSCKFIFPQQQRGVKCKYHFVSRPKCSFIYIVLCTKPPTTFHLTFQYWKGTNISKTFRHFYYTGVLQRAKRTRHVNGRQWRAKICQILEIIWPLTVSLRESSVTTNNVFSSERIIHTWLCHLLWETI